MGAILNRLARCRRGASSAEYALLLALVGGGIVLAALALGGAIGGSMDEAKTNIETCGGTC